MDCEAITCPVVVVAVILTEAAPASLVIAAAMVYCHTTRLFSLSCTYVIGADAVVPFGRVKPTCKTVVLGNGAIT